MEQPSIYIYERNLKRVLNYCRKGCLVFGDNYIKISFLEPKKKVYAVKKYENLKRFLKCNQFYIRKQFPAAFLLLKV